MSFLADRRQLTPSQLYSAGVVTIGAALFLWSGFNVAHAAILSSNSSMRAESSSHGRRSSSGSTRDSRATTRSAKSTEESTVQVTYPTTLEMCDNAIHTCIQLMDSSSSRSVQFPDALPKIRAGALLKLIDVVAGVSARKHAELSCVTVSVDSVLLLAPIYLGDLVHLSASVNRAWGSSLEVGVRVVKEDPMTGDREYVSHAYMTFVAIKSPPGKGVDGVVQPPARVRLASRQPFSTTTFLTKIVSLFHSPTAKTQTSKVQLQALLPRTPLEARRHILAGRRRAKRIANAQRGEARDGVTTETKARLKEEVLLISKTGGKWKGPAEAEKGSWTPGKLKIDPEDLIASAGGEISAVPGAGTSQDAELEALELEFVVQAYVSKDPAVTVNEEQGFVEVNLAGDIPLRHSLQKVEKLAKQVRQESNGEDYAVQFAFSAPESGAVPLPSPSALGVKEIGTTSNDFLQPKNFKPPRARRRSIFLPLKAAQEREGDTDTELSRMGTPNEDADHAVLSEPRSMPKLNKSIKVNKTLARTIHIVFPEHTNSVGVLFGGQLMDWMEEAVLLSVRHVGRARRWGTVSLDGLEFEQAVAVGESMTFTALVIRTFIQSCEVYVLAEAESRNGTRRVTNDALFTLAFPLDDQDIAASLQGSNLSQERQRLLRQVEMPQDSALEQFSRVAVQRRHSRLEMKQMLVRIYSNPS